MTAAECSLARWREAEHDIAFGTTVEEYRARETTRREAMPGLLAFAEAVLALGHVDCPMDPERHPYVGCRCGMSRVYQLAEQHLGGAR